MLKIAYNFSAKYHPVLKQYTLCKGNTMCNLSKDRGKLKWNEERNIVFKTRGEAPRKF